MSDWITEIITESNNQEKADQTKSEINHYLSLNYDNLKDKLISYFRETVYDLSIRTGRTDIQMTLDEDGNGFTITIGKLTFTCQIVQKPEPSRHFAVAKFRCSINGKRMPVKIGSAHIKREYTDKWLYYYHSVDINHVFSQRKDFTREIIFDYKAAADLIQTAMQIQIGMNEV